MEPGEREEIMETTAPADVWKWIAIAALGVIGGMLEGQFIPNRNIVTTDQLAASEQATHAEIADINTKLDEVKQTVDYLKGRADQGAH